MHSAVQWVSVPVDVDVYGERNKAAVDDDGHVLPLPLKDLYLSFLLPLFSKHLNVRLRERMDNNGSPAIDEKKGEAGDGEQSRSGGKKAKLAQIPGCQVEKCTGDLSKEYYRRHRVCELHSKATKVLHLGFEQRFCQQCSRFHALAEFDEAKRSCRRRLAGHNERRRKPPSDWSADRLDANGHQSSNWLTYGGI